MTKTELKQKLSKYVIDKTKAKWKARKKSIDGRQTEIPYHLSGEILLEEVTDDQGRLKGWITVSIDRLAQILNDIADASKPEVTEESTGYKKYLKQWRKEGIEI